MLARGSSLPYSFFLLFALGLAAPEANAAEKATLLYQNDFTSGFGKINPSEAVLTDVNGGTSRIDQVCSGGKKWTVVDDPAGGSNRVLRIHQSGDKSCLTGAATKPKHRAMFWFTDGDKKLWYPPDEHLWLAWRLFIPQSFPAQYLDDNRQAVAHWSYQGETNIRLRGSGNAPLYRVGNRIALLGGPPETYLQDADIPLPKGRWIDVVIHVLRKQDDTGIIEVWIDGDKKVSWHNTRTMSDIGARGLTGSGLNAEGWISQKPGLYWGTEDRPVDFTIYMDNLRYAKGEDGYAVVDPAPDAPPAGADASVDSTVDAGLPEPPAPDAGLALPDFQVTIPDAAQGSLAPCQSSADCPAGELCLPNKLSCSQGESCATEGVCTLEGDVNLKVRVEGCTAGGSAHEPLGIALVLLLCGVLLFARGRKDRSRRC